MAASICYGVSTSVSSCHRTPPHATGGRLQRCAPHCASLQRPRKTGQGAALSSQNQQNGRGIVGKHYGKRQRLLHAAVAALERQYRPAGPALHQAKALATYRTKPHPACLHTADGVPTRPKTCVALVAPRVQARLGTTRPVPARRQHGAASPLPCVRHAQGGQPGAATFIAAGTGAFR